MGLRDFFRRDTVKDPFGGEDGFDGESRFAGQGPKIALIASGAMFIALMGGVAAVVLTGEEVPPPVTGSLADLEIVEDEAAPAAPATPGAPAVAPDATAATDRSADRRPWLTANAPPSTNAQRPGVAEAKPAPAPAAKLVTPPAPPAMTAAIAAPPPPAPPAAKATAQTPMPAKGAAVSPLTPPPPKVSAPDASPPTAKPADSKVAVVTPPVPVAPTAPTPAAKPVADEPDTEELPDPTRDIAGIPALRAADEAPGAPRRFDPVKGDAGPAIAGGRPRLVEPPLPPTDKIAVAAPPPRYANLTDVKGDAAPSAPAPTATKIAFIVGGLGLSATATDAAINKLPPQVTLAFSPYSRDLKRWMEKAKAKGHEVLIELPMESKQFPAEDPGPLGLLTSLDAKDNQERLDTILKDTTGVVGVLDVNGSKFRESREHIDPVFAKLKQTSLVYVQGSPGARIGEATVPTAMADLILDERPFRAAVDARLDYAERLARYQGTVIVAMSAKPVSFERLVLWAAQAQKKGIALAPLSQVTTTAPQ
jgi:polysaccharide deacetylase 2 family uncharacterized protein YibQ